MGDPVFLQFLPRFFLQAFLFALFVFLLQCATMLLHTQSELTVATVGATVEGATVAATVARGAAVASLTAGATVDA